MLITLPMKIEIKRVKGDTDPLTFVLTQAGTKLRFDLSGKIFTLFIGDPSGAYGTYKSQIIGACVGDDPTQGILSFNFQNSDISTAGSFRYAVKMTDASQKIKTIVWGTLSFTEVV